MCTPISQSGAPRDNWRSRHAVERRQNHLIVTTVLTGRASGYAVEPKSNVQQIGIHRSRVRRSNLIDNAVSFAARSGPKCIL